MPYQQPPPSPIEVSFWEAAQELIPSLEREVWIDRYRVDFLIRKHQVVIELYGFAYHNSKQKLTSDAKRERFIQRRGYHILRFTGSEIYRDVDKCVQEVLAFLRTQPEGQVAPSSALLPPAPALNKVAEVTSNVKVPPTIIKPRRSVHKTKQNPSSLGLQSWQMWVLGIIFLLVVGTITALIITVWLTL